MVEEKPKKVIKHKYRIYHGKNNMIYIQFNHKNKEGDIITKTFSKSIKNKSYKDAKKELVLKYYDFTGTKPKSKFQEQEKRKEILEKLKNGLKPSNFVECERWDDIDWNDLFSKPITLMCLASSRSGKTTLMQNVYQKIKDLFSINTLMSGSICSDIYKPFKKCIKLSSINEDYLKLIYTIAKRTKGKYYKWMTFMDDIDIKNKYIDILNKCFFKMRNVNCSTWLNAQDQKLIDKGVRSNTHLVCVMNTSRMDSSRLEYIFEVLQPYFMNEIGSLPKSQQKSYIIKFCHESTKNYGFILVDTLEQKVYICKNKQ